LAFKHCLLCYHPLAGNGYNEALPLKFAAAAQQKKFPGITWKRDFKSVFICGLIFPTSTARRKSSYDFKNCKSLDIQNF
jgi:hypothetical protein